MMSSPTMIVSHRATAGWLLALPFLMLHMDCMAADDKPAEEQQSETVAQQAKKFVESCQIGTTAKTPLSFRRQPEPCLRWSNPTAGEVFGDIYLYTNAGRPAAMVSYYRWFTPDWGSTVEVHSFHNDRVVGVADGVRFWTPMAPGLIYAPLGDAEASAATPAARMVQLRRLADEFVVQLEDTRANSDGVKRSLRRLTQPIYRFPSPGAEADYIDGALFAFVEGTDPELLLFLDAVPAQKSRIWRFAIARLNRDRIRVTRHDKIVWEAEYLTNPYERPREVYTTFNVALLKPAE